MAKYISFQGDGPMKSKLPGAIAADSRTIEFREDYCIDVDPFFGVDEKIFRHDYVNNMYVGPAGAVMNSYIIKGSSDEIATTIGGIVTSYEEEYPEYEFVMLPGRFPVDADVFSTHVLYVKNYEEILANIKSQDTNKEETSTKKGI